MVVRHGGNYTDHGVSATGDSLPTWSYFSQESKTGEGNLVSSSNYRKRKGGTEGKKDPEQWIRGYMSIQRFREIANFGQLPCGGVTYQWNITI